MLQCGSIDDVYSYEKMRRPSPQDQQSPPLSPPSLTKPHHKKTTSSFSISAPLSPTSAKLGSKKTSSFRWITRQSDGGGTSSRKSDQKRGSNDDGKASNMAMASSFGAAAQPPPKKRTKRIGFIDILLGYHALLHASPTYPPGGQRRQLHPTIGFNCNPEYHGTQTWTN